MTSASIAISAGGRRGGFFVPLGLLIVVALLAIVPLFQVLNPPMQSYGYSFAMKIGEGWQPTQWPSGMQPPSQPPFCQKMGWNCVVELLERVDDPGYYKVVVYKTFLRLRIPIAVVEFASMSWDDLGMNMPGNAWLSYFEVAKTLWGNGAGLWLSQTAERVMATVSPGTPHLFVDSAGWGASMAQHAEKAGKVIEWLTQTDFYYVP